MAPQKRARRDDNAEVIAVESASSNLRQDAQRKKARLSVNHISAKSQNTRQRSPSTSSSDADNILDAEPGETPAPSSTQYEILRDNGFKHLQNPDLDDQRATQMFLRRRGQIGDNHAADNAIIEEITCINFMCHERLHVELGPLINFIVGMNGSGKSAVLTAITLCLGGKASATNRGASLKSLIKQGTDQAILTVKLKNEGSDAYQPDLYGDSIIVERHFSKTGSSGYRLKNTMGRTVSTKKGDVDDIIEYFQLQVDNPMNVLTQDAAKSFIQNSTPATKYKFFVEGVQLQQLDNDYKMVSDTCDQIEAKLDEAKKDIKTLKKKADVAQEKANIVEQHKDMKLAARRFGDQLAWAQIEEQEARLAQREKVIADCQENINRAESTADLKDQAFQLANEAMDLAEASARQLEGELALLKEGEESAKSANDEAAAAVQTAHSEQRQIKQSITGAQKKAEGFEKAIAAEKQRIEDANGGTNARKLAEIEDAQQAAGKAKADLEENEGDGPQLQQSLRNAEEALNNARAPHARLPLKIKEYEECQHRLNTLKSDRADVMAGFDTKMPQLIRMIQEDSGFREKPVGPMGLHIKLLNPIWSNVIETTLGGNLSGFVVTSKADQARLSSMMRRLGLERCPILIGNNHRIDTTGHEPDHQYDTILRVMDIDNNLVRNSLIINQGIEQSILISKRSEAHRVMFDGPRLNKVRQCFALHDSRRDFGHRLAWNGRNREMGPVKINMQQKPRMKTDIESQINFQTVTLTQLGREKLDLEKHVEHLRQDMIKCQRAITQNKRAHGELKVAFQRADERVETLQSELDKDNIEDGKLDALKGWLADAQSEEEMYRETYRNSVVEKDKLNETSTARKRELQGVKLRTADHEAKIKKARMKFKNTQQARQIVLTEKNVAIDLIVQLKQEKAIAERKRDQQAEVVSSWTKQATEVCQRIMVDEGETAASLDAKLSKLTDQIKSYNRRVGGTDEEIIIAYEEALRIFHAAASYFTSLAELLTLLKHAFMKRIAQFQRFQRHISARSRINFNYLLSERAFRGKLTIDHKHRKLDVHVEPDETTKNSKGRQTKTLSGGEKSFSSICLLLALWEAMGAPLRCLDEFDVFMDDVNRDVSTRMIITAARRSVGRQYVMITPKALGSGAADAEDVKIIKLFDPRDKQRRIDEMMED